MGLQPDRPDRRDENASLDLRYALKAAGNEGSSWSQVHLIQVLTSLATDLRKHKPYGYMWLRREADSGPDTN